MQATIRAEPEPVALDVARTALIIIDMQRDFLEPGGFGETLGNDVSLLARRRCALPGRCSRRARAAGMLVIHTREGHRPDLSDAPQAKIERGAPIDAHRRAGPDGPHPDPRRSRATTSSRSSLRSTGEPVIDKPGKGAFYATDLTRCCATAASSICSSAASPPRSACTPPCAKPTTAAIAASCSADCCASYFPEFHETGLAMIKAQGGDLRLGRPIRQRVLAALRRRRSSSQAVP